MLSVFTRSSIKAQVAEQAAYATKTIQQQIDAGQESPYLAYVRVSGLDPEQTASQVGQAALLQLGEGFMLDAQLAEEESRVLKSGALLRVLDVSVS